MNIPYDITAPVIPNIASNTNINPINIFVIGPARDTIPSSFKESLLPKIYTAPGATKTNPNINARIIENNNDFFHIINCAFAPKYIAVYLCASSCNIKEDPVTIKLIPNNVKKLIELKLEIKFLLNILKSPKTKVKQIDIAIHANISSLLSLNLFDLILIFSYFTSSIFISQFNFK